MLTVELWAYVYRLNRGDIMIAESMISGRHPTIGLKITFGCPQFSHHNQGLQSNSHKLVHFKKQMLQIEPWQT